MAQGELQIHRIWCVQAYDDGCPGHGDVHVFLKAGEFTVPRRAGMDQGFVKCSVCERWLESMFHWEMRARRPVGVPGAPRVLVNADKREW